MLNRRKLFSPTFNPKKIPNCNLWLDASRATLTRAAGMASQFTRANSEYLSIVDNAAISTGDIDFSFACWVYMDSAPAAQMGIIEKWDTGLTNQREYAFYWDNTSNRFVFVVSPDGTSSNNGSVITNNFGAPSTATNYFIVIWHDSVNNQLGIQVNNGTANTSSYSGGVFDSTSGLSIGAQTNPSTYWDGRISGVGFWKKVLSAAERTQLYNSGVGLAYDELDPGLKTSLVSYWELNEPSGIRNDLHGTNHLTDNNTVTTNPGVIQNAVTTWADLSGQGNNATQATQANKPVIRVNIINGKRVLFFDGLNDQIGGTISTSAGVGLSIYVVGKAITAADADGAEMIYCGGDALDEFRINTTPALQCSLNSVLSTSGSALSLNTNYIFSVIANNINQIAIVNGDPAISAAATYNTGTSKYRIGARDNSSTFTRFWNGYFGEIIVFNRPLNSGENRRILQYLAEKWGVSIR